MWLLSLAVDCWRELDNYPTPSSVRFEFNWAYKQAKSNFFQI